MNPYLLNLIVAAKRYQVQRDISIFYQENQIQLAQKHAELEIAIAIFKAHRRVWK